jgi:hypothetical protein
LIRMKFSVSRLKYYIELRKQSGSAKLAQIR